jgi:hypothetical protein
MIELPADLSAAMLDGSHSARYVADALYNGVVTYPNLPLITAGSIATRAESRIQTSGRIYLRDKSDGVSESLAPDAMMDTLAPFGQEVDIRREVYIGQDFIGARSIGRFRITQVPSIAETRRRVGNAWFRDSVAVELKLDDLFEKLDADTFAVAESPQPGATVWSEIRRISSVPISRTDADAPVGTSTVYEKDRLDVITELMATLGLVPHMTREGALTGRRADPIGDGVAPVADLTGTIRDMSNSLSIDIYNMVIAKGYGSGAAQLVSTDSITEGPLSIYGPLGRRPYEYNSSLMTTQAMVDAAAKTRLSNIANRYLKRVTINCLPRLDLEAGDPVTATDPDSGRVEVGQVTGLDWNLNPTELMTVEITTPKEALSWA